MQNTQPTLVGRKTFISPEDITVAVFTTTGAKHHADRSAARPERSGDSRDSVRTKHWWS